MDFLGIVIVALAGIFTILGSYFEWVWWWRLNGLGKFLYDRYGHKNIRLYEAVMGFVLIAFAARELLISILATGWGKALCIAFVLPVLGFLYYIGHKGAAKAKQKHGGDTRSDISSQ